MHLTDVAIRRAEPREKACRMVEGRGIYFWVTPSSGKL